MKLYVKLAVRNVFRNRRRTTITLATIAFGATAIILFGGYAQNVYQMIRESTIRSQIGHLQLYRKGFSEKGVTAPFDYMITDYPDLRATLLKMDHVRDVVPRLGFSGLVSTGDTTASFVGLGVEPEGESTLSSLARIVAGQDLTSSAPRGAILGLGLYPSWLAMMAVHEAGHVLHAWASGGTVSVVRVPLAGFSIPTRLNTTAIESDVRVTGGFPMEEARNFTLALFEGGSRVLSVDLSQGLSATASGITLTFLGGGDPLLLDPGDRVHLEGLRPGMAYTVEVLYHVPYPTHLAVSGSWSFTN